ncbi:MAG: hypothetical protein PHI97_30525 [Desulfobulbus sp.]|nr:hypothetical protein [Desulfobulbus sp.]
MARIQIHPERQRVMKVSAIPFKKFLVCARVVFSRYRLRMVFHTHRYPLKELRFLHEITADFKK